MEKVLYRMVELADALGISRSKAYELVASGEIPSIRVGGCRRVPVESARQYVAQKLAANAAEIGAGR